MTRLVRVVYENIWHVEMSRLDGYGNGNGTSNGIIEGAVHVHGQVVTSQCEPQLSCSVEPKEQQMAPPAVWAVALLQCGAEGKQLPQSTDCFSSRHRWWTAVPGRNQRSAWRNAALVESKLQSSMPLSPTQPCGVASPCRSAANDFAKLSYDWLSKAGRFSIDATRWWEQPIIKNIQISRGFSNGRDQW